MGSGRGSRGSNLGSRGSKSPVLVKMVQTEEGRRGVFRPFSYFPIFSRENRGGEDVNFHLVKLLARVLSEILPKK